ncbi:MAG: hypothetical protein ABI321_17250, partial [Polyangia bacterium]
MTDPVTAAGVLLKVAPGAVLKGIELAWKGRQGASAQDQALQDAQELALRLWGSWMFEARANLELVRVLATNADRCIFNFD